MKKHCWTRRLNLKYGLPVLNSDIFIGFEWIWSEIQLFQNKSIGSFLFSRSCTQTAMSAEAHRVVWSRNSQRRLPVQPPLNQPTLCKVCWVSQENRRGVRGGSGPLERHCSLCLNTSSLCDKRWSRMVRLWSCQLCHQGFRPWDHDKKKKKSHATYVF